MKISTLPDQFNDFFDFNKKIFPNRLNVPEYFRYFYQDNPLLKGKPPMGYLAWSDEQSITGQFLLTPVAWQCGPDNGMGHWGCDFYVDESQRQSGVGAFLAMKAIQGHKPYFTIGASEDAKKISQSLRVRHIGDLLKFIYFRNLTAPVKLTVRKFLPGLINAIQTTNYPDSIATGGADFIRQPDSFQYMSESGPLLSFARDEAFMTWRFYRSLHKYIVYKNGEDYFICRRLFWHGLSMLVLVDYRTSTTSATDFTLLIKAVKKLAARVRADGIITFSSLGLYDDILKKQLFFKIGRPQPVLTNAQLDLDNNMIAERRAVLATAADCDLDLNLGGAA